MTKEKKFMSDAELRDFLTRYDPVASPARASLAALESAIFARIDEPPHRTAAEAFPVWMLAQSWDARATILAVMLIVVSGFLVGRVTYGATGTASLTSLSPLMAFADTNSFTPAPTPATSWSDDDDE